MPDEPVNIGDRFGDYEITARVGAGGMGEVFRARDRRLDRDVALKFLSNVGDTSRVARFQREAKFVAALNHPNIAAIYGFIDGPTPALVLEFVEGETLADRVAHDRIPVAEAMAIACQLAAALDAAHERGIVHRDLKPANIKITPSGTVKVLDFGIAKALSPHEADAPTKTADGTQVGSVLGTVGYMSPEQTRGLDVDKRTDIWSFGCVLYEMLAGKPAFARGTTSDAIAAILERDPDWTLMPASTPPLVARTIRRCLEKDVKRRQRDIADAAADLRDRTVIAERASTARPRWPWPAVAAALIAATIGAAYFAARGHAATPGLERAVLSQVTFDNGLTTMPALSPDGKLLVYSSDRAGRGDLDLWVEQTSGGPPIRLTDDPADDIQPSFSPDGTQIVFRSERAGGALFLMPALGGAQRLLIEGGRAPRFSPDGKHIAYWKGSWRGGATAGTGTAFTLDLSGGTPLQILAQFAGVREPVWSPDGKALLVLGREKLSQPADLYWVRADNSGALRTGALDDEMRADIERVTSSAGVLGTWTKSGVLLSARSGLWMLPISASNGQLTGAAKRLTVGAGEYLFSTADDTGAIVFASIVSTRVIERAPVTHSGTATVLWSDSSGAASRPSQTPDGSHVLYERRGPGYYDLWIRVGTSPDRLVFRAPSRGANPVISPDGSMVAYTVLKPNSARDGEAFAIAGAGGVPQRICSDCMAWGFLSNNRSILIQDGEFKRLRAVDVHTGDSRVILETPKSMDRPHVSPDERHIAFNFDGKQWIAPVYADQPTPQPQWQQVREHTVGGRACGWSLDSQTAYLLLDTDGFRCLWGQRVDAKTGNLVGEPFAVRHFHSTIEQEFSTSVGNAISTAGFIYGGGRLKANLWRLTLPR